MVTGLEGLRIFQLAEKLADEIWEEVVTWKGLFPVPPSGKSWSVPPTRWVRILPKATDDFIIGMRSPLTTTVGGR